MSAPGIISCDKLAKLVDKKPCPVIFDVRRDVVKADDLRLLPGAWAHAEADMALDAVGRLVVKLTGPAVVT